MRTDDHQGTFRMAVPSVRASWVMGGLAQAAIAAAFAAPAMGQAQLASSDKQAHSELSRALRNVADGGSNYLVAIIDAAAASNKSREVPADEGLKRAAEVANSRADQQGLSLAQAAITAAELGLTRSKSGHPEASLALHLFDFVVTDAASKSKEFRKTDDPRLVEAQSRLAILSADTQKLPLPADALEKLLARVRNGHFSFSGKSPQVDFERPIATQNVACDMTVNLSATRSTAKTSGTVASPGALLTLAGHEDCEFLKKRTYDWTIELEVVGVDSTNSIAMKPRMGAGFCRVIDGKSCGDMENDADWLSNFTAHGASVTDDAVVILLRRSGEPVEKSVVLVLFDGK